MSELEQAFNFKELGEEGLDFDAIFGGGNIPRRLLRRRSPFRNQNPLPKTEPTRSSLLCRTRPARTWASCLTW